jgi:hypothetical protein
MGFGSSFNYDLNLIEAAHVILAESHDATSTADSEEARQKYAALVNGHPSDAVKESDWVIPRMAKLLDWPPLEIDEAR